VAEAARGAKDPEVARLARDEGRVLLTEDISVFEPARASRALAEPPPIW